MTVEVPEVMTTARRAGWTLRLLTAAVATTFGASLPVGYNIGVINAPAEIIKTFCNESMYTRYGAVLNERELEVLWSAIVSVFLIGGVTGSLTGSWLADRLGRKGAYVISTLLNIAAAGLFYGCRPANSVEMLIAGRLLVGLAAGLITCVVPMYLTELSPLHLRGGMGVMCPLGVTIGVLMGQVASLGDILGTKESWPDLLAFYVLLVFACSLAIPFFPESPKYLYVIKKQPQKALEELEKVRGLPSSYLSEEIHDLQVSQRNDEESGVKWSLAKIVRDRELLLPLLLVCSLQAGQQLSGINAVFYYSVSIFKTAGLNEKEGQLANIGAGGVNLFMGIVAIPLMAHCNRRRLLLISIITAAMWLIILGLSIAFMESVWWMPYVSIVSVLLYVLCYQVGLGPIPYFIGSELFAVGPRPAAMALGSMANWAANFLVGMSFPTLQSTMGPGSFAIFALITMMLFIFIKKYFPETRGKDPSDVAMLCRHGLSSRPLDSPTSTGTTETLPVMDIKPIN